MHYYYYYYYCIINRAGGSLVIWREEVGHVFSHHVFVVETKIAV